MTNYKTFTTLFLAGIIFVLGTTTVSAQSFSLSPAKVELSLAPGQSNITNLLVRNDQDRTVRFFVEVEDFVGSDSPESAVQLLNEENSPYSLKRYISVGAGEFFLGPGQTRLVPVAITLPASAPPGGLYSAVLVSTEKVGSGPITPTVRTRVGSLFFVRIDGPVNESGALTGFGLVGGRVKFLSPGSFFINYKNDGNVYLNPYGVIEIKNIFGQKISQLPIDPWFVMPDSERVRDLASADLPGWGIYRAEIFMNRGYGDIIDQQSYYFLSLHLVSIIVSVLIIGLVLWGIIRLKKKYVK